MPLFITVLCLLQACLYYGLTLGDCCLDPNAALEGIIPAALTPDEAFGLQNTSAPAFKKAANRDR